MPCSSYLQDLSNAIWHDLNDPADLSVAAIQSKLTTTAFLGQLDSLVGMCHTIVSGDISPVLDADEQGIYSLMYQSAFYGRKIASIANGTDLAWISLAEGDSRVVRASPVDYMRLYRDEQKQINDQLRILSNAYRADGSTTRDVAFLNQNNNAARGETTVVW